MKHLVECRAYLLLLAVLLVSACQTLPETPRQSVVAVSTSIGLAVDAVTLAYQNNIISEEKAADAYKALAEAHRKVDAAYMLEQSYAAAVLQGRQVDDEQMVMERVQRYLNAALAVANKYMEICDECK